jgi:hypothetical protein
MSPERPSRLDDDARVGRLGEILQGPPSEAVWRALWDLFAGWPDGESRARSLDAAERALAAWPDELRFVTTSNALLHEGQSLSALTRLVRAIEVHRREQHGTADLQAIASSPHIAGLTSLSIQRSEIDSRAWQALSESAYTPNLRHLHVSRTVLSAADLQHLFQSSRFPRLQCLKLIDVGLQPRRLEGVRGTRLFGQLSKLDLSSNGLGDDGVTVLSQEASFLRIEHLTLRSDYLRLPGVRALLAGARRERTQELDVRDNDLTGSEQAELAALAATRNVRLIV